MFILDGLLEQQTSLRPVELMADTAGSGDVVFGLFWLLGYQFSPRLADLGEARFWRTDRAVDYGPLNGLARHRLDTELIARNWDDLLPVAGSLKLGMLSASEFMRTSRAAAAPLPWRARSPRSGVSPRPCSCWPTSTTRIIGAASWSN